MTENLKVTINNEENSIPLNTSYYGWSSLKSSVYCRCNNDTLTNKDVYGATYNSYAVSEGELSPVGWHVPTDDEWNSTNIVLS